MDKPDQLAEIAKMADELELVKNELTSVKEQLSRLTQICIQIEETSRINAKASNMMVNHIGLVESVYTTVRSPLDYIRRRFAYVTGETTSELPRLK